LWFASLLTLTNGFMDAHTYYVRGGVFANVPTASRVRGAHAVWVAAAALAVTLVLFIVDEKFLR
jgi:uncharacterized membrane protein YoaK (UPF0700 family)